MPRAWAGSPRTGRSGSTCAKSGTSSRSGYRSKIKRALLRRRREAPDAALQLGLRLRLDRRLHGRPRPRGLDDALALHRLHLRLQLALLLVAAVEQVLQALQLLPTQLFLTRLRELRLELEIDGERAVNPRHLPL